MKSVGPGFTSNCVAFAHYTTLQGLGFPVYTMGTLVTVPLSSVLGIKLDNSGPVCRTAPGTGNVQRALVRSPSFSRLINQSQAEGPKAALTTGPAAAWPARLGSSDGQMGGTSWALRVQDHPGGQRGAHLERGRGSLREAFPGPPALVFPSCPILLSL